MPLIVTPGASNADAFISLAAFKAYCDAVGYDYSAYDDTDEIEPAIRRGTTHLSNSFSWKGSRTNGRGQALAWPRSGATDGEGEDIPSDEIPAEIERACCEAGWYELQNPGGLNPAVNLSQRVKAKGIGPLRKEYFPTANTVEAARTTLTGLSDMVKDLVSGSGNALVGRLERA